ALHQRSLRQYILPHPSQCLTFPVLCTEPAASEIYTLSLHDALPISPARPLRIRSRLHERTQLRSRALPLARPLLPRTRVLPQAPLQPRTPPVRDVSLVRPSPGPRSKRPWSPTRRPDVPALTAQSARGRTLHQPRSEERRVG